MKQALRNHLLQTCSDEELTRWFDPLDFAHDPEARRLTVVFPHALFSQWFEQQIQSRFEEQLGQFFSNGYAVSYENPGNHVSSGNGGSTTTTRIDFPFDPQFTFDTFLVNKKNYFPLASAKEVAKQDNVVFNPFVICGKNGSGKSHIVRAVANEISKRRDAESILLVSVGELKNLYQVTAGGDVFKARNHIFGHDFLFVDDLHQLRGDSALQQELVVIFNHFYDNKKQMIFCCPDKLSAYDFLNPTLKSRLEWGLIVNLKQPDLEIRVDYIKQMCSRKRLPLAKSQILTLAQRFQDFRYLQGILLKLFAFRELVRQDISDKDFEHILNNTEEKTTEALSADSVMTTVSEHMAVPVKDLKGSKRQQRIAHARQVAMYLCRQLLGISYPSLGRAFGGKDHSTVLYSVRKIEKMQRDNEDLNQLLKELKEKCLLQGS